MANRESIAAHYDILGPLHAIRLLRDQDGFPDYTNAFWDGDFTKSLHKAQLDKHQWILGNLGLPDDLTGYKLLDIGCGWGPILEAVRKRGGTTVGLTLSEHQYHHCRKAGFEVYLRDYKTLGPGELGIFDAVVSIGAIEHFCSIQERIDGNQEHVYQDFFRTCAEHLKAHGGLFLQTMTWNDRPPNYADLSLQAPSDSPEAIVARMEYFYPDSWLPDGLAQLQKCAQPRFDLTLASDGRLDYIETLKRWGASTSNLYPWNDFGLFVKAVPAFVKLAYGLTTSRSARIQFESLNKFDQRECFARGIMGHKRMFFTRT